MRLRRTFAWIWQLTLFKSRLNCSITSHWLCLFTAGVETGLPFNCSRDLTQRSYWLDWLFDIAPDLYRIFNCAAADEAHCLYNSQELRELEKELNSGMHLYSGYVRSLKILSAIVSNCMETLSAIERSSEIVSDPTLQWFQWSGDRQLSYGNQT